MLRLARELEESTYETTVAAAWRSMRAFRSAATSATTSADPIGLDQHALGRLQPHVYMPNAQAAGEKCIK
ncbi:hypothetical protein RW1_035_00180 [Rhodococcus wratislaviensis NBRC 100605]|uniref:Uncharacterized protein n=1 Tax=Rhodococcus wratislaviensis NBRC 100605 TaxID=1219028 RepID=X0R7C2_RHOWR|nr:hypothetical protein RW1_035_00180 [Rhodococcus wratislaviensis NBRC 100605]